MHTCVLVVQFSFQYHDLLVEVGVLVPKHGVGLSEGDDLLDVVVHDAVEDDSDEDVGEGDDDEGEVVVEHV